MSSAQPYKQLNKILLRSNKIRENISIKINPFIAVVNRIKVLFGWPKLIRLQNRTNLIGRNMSRDKK